MHGIITTLLAGRGSLLTPIAAPIAYLPIKMVADPTFGRVSVDDPNYAQYRRHLRRTTDEPFALFLPGLGPPALHSRRSSLYSSYSK
ncbi:hypothetical protein ACFIOY_03590 [Bradyrhizobium sp. TZ2]